MEPQIYSVTLAAGAGTRMPDEMPAKPCCRIGPKSVIENALETYESAGIYHHLIVVGRNAEEVIAEASRHKAGVLFAYQPVQRGTGDAVKCGLKVLEDIGHEGDVLIAASDKVIALPALRALLESYRAGGFDLHLLVGSSADFPLAGRIILRKGNIEAILEVADIRLRQFAARLKTMARQRATWRADEVAEAARTSLREHRRVAARFPGLMGLMERAEGTQVTREEITSVLRDMPDFFELPGGRLSVEEAAAARLCNLGVYLGRRGRIAEALESLGTDNAQGEYYFTDIVHHMAAAGGRIGFVQVTDHTDVMSFNTLAELEQVRKIHAVKLHARMQYPKVEEWINCLSGSAEPHRLALAAAEGLAGKTGLQRRCIMARAPGRINIMGRHVDHQGGICNLMAIDRELVIAAAPRDDDRINLWNSRGDLFPERSFTIGELTAEIDWQDWLRTLESQFIRRMVSRSAGDWANYVKGAALRLQHRFPDRKLRGMDAFVCSSIPVAAGLSSSSALVVAAAEALTELNALNIRPVGFVDLCGEGEWFVGNRGGNADYAAMKFGQPGEVVSVSFFPFCIVGRCPLPEEYSLMVCHSGQQTTKTQDARARFNANVACYHMAREIVKEKLPHKAEAIQHLRDITTDNLGLSLPALYRLILAVPAAATAEQAEAMANRYPTVGECLRGLDLQSVRFRPRDVALFGLSECERAARARHLLARSDVQAFGRMMSISHDGDRVARWNGRPVPFDSRASDERMEELIRLSSQLAPLEQTGSALWQQPGAYDCSMEEIDQMVDLITPLPGVMGAQLAGAGLGGCIMALVRNERIEQVQQSLLRHYYEPRQIEPRLFICRPSAGSRVMTSPEQWP